MDYIKLNSFLTEYTERNFDNQYKPVAVGRYGIRTRESIYSKELAKDYSKNKVIFQNTLTVGMGSVQIDIGILTEDVKYSVSPAYHTYKITGINPHYLRYCLECRNQDMFERYVKRGSRQGKTIDLGRWLAYEIPVCETQKQQEIVSKLDFVDSLITSRREQLTKLDELVKFRFIELFGDRWANNLGWPQKPLRDCATFYNGKAHEQVVDENGEYVLVTSKCIVSDQREYRRTNTLLFPLQSGDICMVMSDVPNGRALAKCMMINEDNRYTLNQRICCLRGYSLHPVFFMHALNRHEYFLSFNDGDSQTNLRKDDLLSCPIILPPMELQEQFASFVEQTDKSKLCGEMEVAA